jgi:hypothetical protein
MELIDLFNIKNDIKIIFQIYLFIQFQTNFNNFL